MNTKEDNFDLKQVIHTCTKCNNIMRFHSTEEIETKDFMLHFVVYLCETCDETIWILDRNNQYMEELSEYTNEMKIC